MSEETKYPSQLAERFQIRMPDGLRDEIKISADLNGRSMNAEIVQRLRQSYQMPSPDKLVIALPDEVQRSVEIDAIARDMTESDLVAEILSAKYAPGSDHVRTLDRLQEEILRNADLRDQVAETRERLERDFVLYYGKAVQLNQFAKMVTNSNAVPEFIRSAATELEMLTSSELTMLRRRYEEGLFWVERRDLEKRNSKEAATIETDPFASVDLSAEGVEAMLDQLDRELESAQMRGTAESSKPGWDWNVDQADPPTPVQKPKSDRAKKA
ncbi:hypothetical protein PDO_4479 [Rhizobium sp. PDO1-076]|uniref:Arc family DNA-binding protein n=1 Tax=Rhizobium sp. PDO1-076 TaxID=1125979 RepID=UPI00024E2CAA|nr:Arc family DNA-binding protein [Rhizobium sp. PDO1-076]EHS53017.1 hypothetical protein PDO_4479 [Rhizobium sp. PDO1-076]